MEFTLDVSLVRAILRRESAQLRDDIRDLGVLPGFGRSLERHDARIAAAPDVSALACRPECTWCCHFTVDVRAVEVFGILDFVASSLTREEGRRVLAEVRANSRVLAGLNEDARITRNIRCPFLSDGRCAIYPVRPQSCRNYHATDVAGCRQSYEEPLNQDIDPDFAPGVYQAGEAHVEAVSNALAAMGYDTDAYELNGALNAALTDAGARERFAAGLKPFVDLDGEPVAPEFDDLVTGSGEGVSSSP